MHILYIALLNQMSFIINIENMPQNISKLDELSRTCYANICIKMQMNHYLKETTVQ